MQCAFMCWESAQNDNRKTGTASSFSCPENLQDCVILKHNRRIDRPSAPPCSFTANSSWVRPPNSAQQGISSQRKMAQDVILALFQSAGRGLAPHVLCESHRRKSRLKCHQCKQWRSVPTNPSTHDELNTALLKEHKPEHMAVAEMNAVCGPACWRW